MEGRPALGQRIAVIGTSGSGKTRVAESLAQKLGVPYVNNDAIIWRPDWVPTPRDQRQTEMEAATRGPAWTFDGNFSTFGAMPVEDEVVLDRCDTIVWLDLPRWQVWSQVTRRTLLGLVTGKPNWRGGNSERWSIFFSRENIIWWSIKTFASRRRAYERLFADPAYQGLSLVRLRSRREVDGWLKGISARAPAHE